ncbi:MAG TPA: UvrD-helicase domain-containing protein [Solirubrobacteraceae bacterium]
MNQPFDAREFDVCGPLPTGVTVLEASAGTGKTYTIAALAARYVAEGIPLERLLLVTFTRMATGELRERVRERLVSAERGLAAALTGVALDHDPVLARLAEGSPEEIELRRDRLRRAVSGFDAATIATTHGFCQEVLDGLGIAGDLDPDVAFVEDLSDLASDTIDDLYVRRFSLTGTGSPEFGRAEAAAIARAAIENPGATIVTSGDETPAMRGRLAVAAREEFERRKRGLRVMTYDDLVTRLDRTLAGPGGAAAAQALASRFAVVLVDEFQDTDPAQWAIMRRAFADTGVTLVLIADPKQAIYAFRGADVYSYHEAAQSAGTRATLRVNWRSDQGLIDAHDALLSDVKLGHPGIVYRHVRASESHVEPRLSGAPVAAPLRFRVLGRDHPTLSLTQYGYARNASARELITADLASDLVALLGSGAQLERRDPDGGTQGRESVCPGHLAVLVRTNRQAAMVRETLGAAGVPAVINGAGSVFATDPARDWLALLEALERPASMSRAHAAVLTPFLGWSAAQLAGADEDSFAWEAVHRRLHDWARVLRSRGVASLQETITLGEGLPARMLGLEDGERTLTDLRHVGQLLHTAAAEEQLGTTALTAWLRSRIAEAELDTSDEERSRRLESDAEAVQVLTIHRSKGLEFPIVYLPFLWEPGYIAREAQPVFFHDPEAGDARTLDVALEGPDYDAHRDQFLREQRGEDLRLAYVALTRACHQAVVWWAGSWDSRNSPLGRLLFSRQEDGEVAPIGNFTPDDPAVAARLNKIAERAPGQISVERAAAGLGAVWRAPRAAPAALGVSPFARSLDLRWRRTSYTDITAASHESWVGSEPEEPLVGDEPSGPWAPIAPDEPEGAGAGGDGAHPLPLAEMPVGTDIGTFVHRVLEAADFAAGDLEAELTSSVTEVQSRRGLDIGDTQAVVAGLAAALRTPLGPQFGDLRLSDVKRSDRLDELGFELPLAGGDQPRGTLGLSDIADILRSFLSADDPLRGYAERLSDAGLRQAVRGYLTGSLDLVVRLPGTNGTQFAVFDYKTNWLGSTDAPLAARHYRPAAIALEMQRHHYVLQALLYLVALHRYLRWRQPDQDPEQSIAGVGYLFLRGMTGDGEPHDGPTGEREPGSTRTGVFSWRPPAGLVAALSAALDGRGAVAA